MKIYMVSLFHRATIKINILYFCSALSPETRF